eukprot:scaffold449_cov241-Pinguiococcus_pyrenoidosus.AAC.29
MTLSDGRTHGRRSEVGGRRSQVGGRRSQVALGQTLWSKAKDEPFWGIPKMLGVCLVSGRPGPLPCCIYYFGFRDDQRHALKVAALGEDVYAFAPVVKMSRPEGDASANLLSATGCTGASVASLGKQNTAALVSLPAAYPAVAVVNGRCTDPERRLSAALLRHHERHEDVLAIAVPVYIVD